MKLPRFLTINHLKNYRQYGLVISTACYFYSGIWIAIELLSHFVDAFDEWSGGNLLMLVVIIVVGAFVGIVCFLRKRAKMLAISEEPKILSVSEKLSEADVLIEIRVDDIFNIEGGVFVISTNTTFDTDISGGLISADSLQGQFTQRYYNAVEHLDYELEQKLENQSFTLVKDNRKGKQKRYEIGTVVGLQPQGQMAYWIAIADTNEHGVPDGSLEEIVECLGKLWHHIGEQGELGNLIVPVLGTGRARVNAPREKMIREIIQSFIAACSEKKFAEKLTIVISPKDHCEYDIDLHELEKFLQHLCKYTEFKDETATGKGEAIP